MAWPPILVRYGEIGIKSRSVRASFERRLMDRIEEQLVQRGVEGEVAKLNGRVFVRARDTEAALDALRHTFGVVSASPAVECDATPAAVAEVALRVARERLPPGGSFALRVKRSGTHTFTSLDVAKAGAERILAELADRKPMVDLDAPDLAIHAEVREDEGFVFTRTVRGPGGLPMGSQGKVGVLVEDARAAAAAWLMAKRGSAIVFFTADPEAAAAWLKPLEAWMPHRKLRAIEGATREARLRAVAPELVVHKCQALALADALDDAFLARDEDALAGLPVFRPLTGYAGPRLVKLLREAELPEA